MNERKDERGYDHPPQNPGDPDSSGHYQGPPHLIKPSSPMPVKAGRVKSRVPTGHVQSDEDDLEVQELEIQLQMAKLKQQHKRLKAKRGQKLQLRDASDDDFVAT